MDISNFVGFANDLEDRGAVGKAGFDSNSLWTITTPAGLRRCAPCPDSAVGVICEPGALRSNPPFRRLNKKGHLLRMTWKTEVPLVGQDLIVIAFGLLLPRRSCVAALLVQIPP